MSKNGFRRFNFSLIPLLATLFGLAAISSARASIVPFVESSNDVVLSLFELSPLVTPWDRLLDQDGGSGVLFGVNLLGPSPFARNEAMQFAPASNTKLFTVSALLDRLGPDFRYETKLEWNEIPGAPHAITHLTLVGSGDPSWGMSELGEKLTTRIDAFAQALASEGVKEVRGRIQSVGEDPRWDALRFPDGWSADDATHCYGALAQAFVLDINCAVFVVTSQTTGKWSVPGVPVEVKLSLKKGSVTSLDVNPPTTVQGAFVIRGTWAAGSAPQSVELPIQRASEWVNAVFSQSLQARGILLTSAEPASFDPSALSRSFYSPPLSAIIQPLLKKSINVVGEALFKTLGARFGDASEDLLLAARGAMRAYLEELGADFASQVTLVDGSGLSRSNSVTTISLMTLLRDRLSSEKSASFKALWEGLPIAGVDGTLAGRMKGTAAEGVLRAKTGTLSGVSALSGYVPSYNAAGQITAQVPFVILSKFSAEKAVASKAAQDRVGVTLSKLVNAPQGSRPLP